MLVGEIMEEYYAKINEKEYLVPYDIVAVNASIFNKYMSIINEKKYLNIEMMVRNEDFFEVRHIYQTMRNYIEAYAMDMSATMSSDREDPLVKYMSIKTRINDGDKKLVPEVNTDRSTKEKIVLDGMSELLGLYDTMILDDEYESKRAM